MPGGRWLGIRVMSGAAVCGAAVLVVPTVSALRDGRPTTGSGAAVSPAVPATAPTAGQRHGSDRAVECSAPEDRPQPAASPAPVLPQHPASMTVTVRVPRTAMIKIDASGQVVAAWTNTGCSPSRTDDLWVMRPDGSIGLAPSPALAEISWRGDFSAAGVFVAQSDPGPDASG